VPRYHRSVSFKDHFSRHSADYQQYRPHYPPELAEYLARTAPGTGLALDAATGNGQAAADLALHFERVLASDASENQLRHAVPHARVCYLRHAAESLPVRSGVADLLTIAQAAHWLDLPRVYSEARRVLRPAGLVALWCYALFSVDSTVDAVVGAFYRDRVGRYWPPERRLIDEGYRSLPFPFAELSPPPFELTADWPLEAVIHYVGTWSAVMRCREQTGEDPLPGLRAQLDSGWPEGGTRRLRWPIHLRIGRVGPI
jgi:SAM-dependent methyltransferase